MLLIHCPWCGPRDEIEFKYGGEAHITRPADPEALSDAAMGRLPVHARQPHGRSTGSDGSMAPAAGGGSTSPATRRPTKFSQATRWARSRRWRGAREPEEPPRRRRPRRPEADLRLLLQQPALRGPPRRYAGFGVAGERRHRWWGGVSNTIARAVSSRPVSRSPTRWSSWERAPARSPISPPP